jgi:hypothetical protein
MNLIESTFATVRLRTDKTKGCLSRETALAMVDKLAKSAERSWRRLDGSQRLAQVIQGIRFRDGEPVQAAEDQAAACTPEKPEENTNARDIRWSPRGRPHPVAADPCIRSSDRAGTGWPTARGPAACRSPAQARGSGLVGAGRTRSGRDSGPGRQYRRSRAEPDP